MSAIDAFTNATARERLKRKSVQDELHTLDDAGRGLMRNGFYRLSESERQRA